MTPAPDTVTASEAPSESQSTPRNVGYSNKMLCFLKIEVWLIYNVALVLSVQRSDSGIYIYIYIFFSRFFSIIGYYKILSIVPCAIQSAPTAPASTPTSHSVAPGPVLLIK